MTTSASLCEGPIFYFMFVLYAWVKVIFTFPFSFYPLASSLCLKDHDTYIQLDVSWHRLLLLTSPKGEYVGRQHNKRLSFLVSDWNSITTITAWVLAIVEDYMIVECVDLLKSSILDSFWCYDKLQLLQWLRLKFVSSQWSFWTMLDIVKRLLL